MQIVSPPVKYSPEKLREYGEEVAQLHVLLTFLNDAKNLPGFEMFEKWFLNNISVKCAKLETIEPENLLYIQGSIFSLRSLLNVQKRFASRLQKLSKILKENDL